MKSIGVERELRGSGARDRGVDAVPMLRFSTAGESHGKCLTGMLEGLPSGMAVDTAFIDHQLHRRQQGHGRSERMKMEKDRIEITAGVRHGKTLGSPIAFTLCNKDWENWKVKMSPNPVGLDTAVHPVTQPRPGHVDLAGALKHQTHDVRDVFERASARETAARVAIGAFCKLLLMQFDIRIGSHVLAVGGVSVSPDLENADGAAILAMSSEEPLPCLDADARNRMIASMETASRDGDTLGGVVEVIATSVPPGLGSHVQWDRRLDGRLAQALMSIPAVKAVEIGNGIAAARQFGSGVHDEIYYSAVERRFVHRTNNAGGLEAGITNGADVRARMFVKPVPTLRKPLMSVDLHTKQASVAAFERSDICVVPSVGVIAEAMLGIVLAEALLEKCGGDSMIELEANFAQYQRLLAEF